MILDVKNKKILTIVFSLLIVFILGFILIQNAFFKPTRLNYFIASKIYKTPANKAFTDENFYKCVVDAYNEKNNTSVAYTTSLTDEQLKTITYLSCSGYNKNNEEKIVSVAGIEKLIALTGLSVGNNQLTSIDVSKNTALTGLWVYFNQLTNLDVSNNKELKSLHAYANQLTSIDVSQNTALTKLSVQNNQLTNLDVSQNIALTELGVGNNQLTNIDVSKNTALTYLDVHMNQLTDLDVSQNIALTFLDVDNNQLTSIDVSNNKELKTLYASYNQLINLDVGKNTALTRLGVDNNQLTSIDVSNNKELKTLYASYNQLINLGVSQNTALTELSVGNNQLTSIDVSKNTALTKLYVEDNQLTSIDVSQNTSLTSLKVCDNLFSRTIGIYKNNEVNINALSVPIKLPEGKTSTLVWIIQNNSIVDKVDTSNQGYYQYDLRFEHNIAKGIYSANVYKIKLNLYVIEATSNKYDINAEEGYIYTKTDTDEETILSNINLNYGEASIEDNKLLIKYDGELIKSFDIVNVSSDVYKITDDYLYFENGNMMSSNIKLTNATYTMVEDYTHNNKMSIQYNGKEIDILDFVTYWSKDYDLTKDYIFVEEELNLDLINTKNLIKEVVDNKLIIRYNDEIFKSMDIVKTESNKYDLSKDYIYTGTDDLDLNDINVINGQKSIEDNKLLVKYNDDLLKEYAIYNINFGEYKTYDGLLVLPEDITYEGLINNITTNGVTYKIFNGESEVTEGNISEGMIIKIYYENEVIDEYEVTNEYLEFDESLNIDNEISIMEKLPRNLKLKDFILLINTSGSIEVKNNNNELLSDDLVIGTGSKLKIALSKRTVEYTLSVRGDVTGNGQAKMADVMKIATHIIEGNVISGDAFEMAADITGDGKIKMNDVMKLATFIIDGGEL